MKINKILQISEDSISDSLDVKIKKLSKKNSSANNTNSIILINKPNKPKGRVIPPIEEEDSKKYEMKIIEDNYIRSMKEARGFFLESDIENYTDKLARSNNPVKIYGKLPSIFNNKKQLRKLLILKPSTQNINHTKTKSITSSDLCCSTQSNQDSVLKRFKVAYNLKNKYKFYEKNTIKTEENLNDKCFRNKAESLKRLNTSSNTTSSLRRKFVNKINIEEFATRFKGPRLVDQFENKQSFFNLYINGKKSNKKGENYKSFNGYGLGHQYNLLSTSQKKVVKIKYGILKEKNNIKN